MIDHKRSQETHREFGNEAAVEKLTGRKKKTLQKDRLFGRGFPYYKIGRQIVYDLAEIRNIIHATRVEPKKSGGTA